MNGTVRLVTDSATADDFFQEFGESDRVLSFDTETTGLQVRSGWHDKGRTVQVSFRPWDTAYVFEMTDRWRDSIFRAFDMAEELVAFNAKFDAHVLTTFGYPIYEKFEYSKVHDARFLARLHDERDKASLKALSTKYLDDSAADSQTQLKRIMRNNKWDWATVPVNYLVEYGGNDAILTGRLFDLMYPMVHYAYDAYYRELRLQPVLFKMERRGIKVDQDLLAQVIEEERRKVDEAAMELEHLSPGLNPRSPIQMKAAFRDLGIELDDTQAPTLKAIDHPLAHAVLRYREHAKVLGTYAEPWARLITPEGRIHPSFNSMGTVTGRFSSDHPNLQNVSKTHKLRDVFIADEGEELVVADWNQAELRLYAHFAKDENMRAAFLSGDDIYQQAADLLGVPRQVGKMIMLASIYGAGPKALKRQCVAMSYKYGMADLVPELLKYDWDELYTRFHRSYGIRELARLTELQARRRGMLDEPYILTLGGRRQRPKYVLLKPVNGYRQRIETYKDLGNSLVQGSSADLMKMALIAMDEAGHGDKLLLTVHDEMVASVPKDEVEDVKELMREVMTRNEFIPPLTVEVSSAYRYGEAK